MECYREIKLIGRGNYGSAVLVEKLDSGVQYVIKKISIFEMSTAERDQAKQEVVLLANLKHPCIVRYEGSFIQDGHLHIVMQFCENGDLGAKIREAKKKGVRFAEDQVLDWFTQLAMAVAYIHRRRILHRDLKSSNVFLARDNLVRLGDFGIARVLVNTLDQAKTVVGTPYYMSPEVCADKHYGERSDIWALGCVLYEMATLQHPFQSNNLLGLVHKIVHEHQAPLPEGYSPELGRLVEDLLQKDPALRPDAADILKRPLIAERVLRLTPVLEGRGGDGGGTTVGRARPLVVPASTSQVDSAVAAKAAAARSACVDAPPSLDDPRGPPLTGGGAFSGAHGGAGTSAAADAAEDEPAAGLVSPVAVTPVQRVHQPPLAPGHGRGGGGSSAPSAAAAAAAAMVAASAADYGFHAPIAPSRYGDEGGAPAPARMHLPPSASDGGGSQQYSRMPSPVSTVAADLGRLQTLQQQQQGRDAPLLSPTRRAGGGGALPSSRPADLPRRSSEASDGGKSSAEPSPLPGSPYTTFGSPRGNPTASPTPGGGQHPSGVVRRRSGAESVVAAARASVERGGGAPPPPPASSLGSPTPRIALHGQFTHQSSGGSLAPMSPLGAQMRRASIASDDGAGSVASERRASVTSTGSAAARAMPLPPLNHAGSVGGGGGSTHLLRAPSSFQPDGGQHFAAHHHHHAAAAASHAHALASPGVHPIGTRRGSSGMSGGGGASMMSPAAPKPSVDVAGPLTRGRSTSGASAPGGSVAYAPAYGGGSAAALAPVTRSSSGAAGVVVTTTATGSSTVRTIGSDDGVGVGPGGSGGGFGILVSPRSGHPVPVVRRVSKTAGGRQVISGGGMGGGGLGIPPGSAGSGSRAGSAGSVSGGGLFSHHRHHGAGLETPTLIVLDDAGGGGGGPDHHHHGHQHAPPSRGSVSAAGTASGGGGGAPAASAGAHGRPWTTGAPAAAPASSGHGGSSGAAVGAAAASGVRVHRVLSAVTEGSLAAEVPDEDDDAAPAFAAAGGGGSSGRQRVGGRLDSGGSSAGLHTSTPEYPSGGGATGRGSAASQHQPGPARHPGARGGLPAPAEGQQQAYHLPQQQQQQHPQQHKQRQGGPHPAGGHGHAHAHGPAAASQHHPGRPRSTTAESYAEDFDLGEPEDDDEEESDGGGAEGGRSPAMTGRAGGPAPVAVAGGGGAADDVPWDLAESDDESDDDAGDGGGGRRTTPVAAARPLPLPGASHADQRTRGGQQGLPQPQQRRADAVAYKPTLDIGSPESSRRVLADHAAPYGGGGGPPSVSTAPPSSSRKQPTSADIAFTPANAAMTRARCVAALGAPAFERVYAYLSAARAPGGAAPSDAAKRDALAGIVGGKRALLDACGLVESLVSMEARARA